MSKVQKFSLREEDLAMLGKLADDLIRRVNIHFAVQERGINSSGCAA